MLDAMTGAPAFVSNGRLDILGANQLGYALYSEIFRAPARPANHARFVFLDPRSHDFYPDWERAANDTVALLRAEAGRDPYDRNLVHAHHGAEDVLLSPALRAPEPSIGPVVDRPEADHARVSDLLDVVEAAARSLSETEGGEARQRVIDGLQDLHLHLLEHLDYEERNAGPVMRRLDRPL